MTAFLHQMPGDLATRAWRVVVVGAGGTGSALLPNLARLHHAMVELGHPGGIACTVFDDDTVSESNVGRQGFYPNDVGLHKAPLLVNRLNNLMGTRWEAQVRRIGSRDRLACDLVIGCVDTRAARKAILSSMEGSYGACYYLDCGNETDRGQVILGQVGKRMPQRLPHVGDLFPELMDPKGDATDTAPSCSMEEALRKQSLVINQAIAVQAYNLLWTLFRTGSLSYSGVFVNLSAGRVSPLNVDPEVWARFGYDPKAKRKRKLASAA
ncbi:thiamine biosynthesis protein ThiF (plasmid) [Cupriavidus sp. USMAA2-4]|jgi:PRTRC genetic system ThiF family protein|uniref:PRTRC system ThiF family protein n=1 Tax=Cupriavidus sp. USMAA2-4 TaxID=876364 RepID=UPI0008A6C74B|nr:PRTRC system ThiF family protein [Cupriavidus sp. USMAA2-4]AOY97747.1 thiamine biosynthesis protein ThiF [Cupriavidus sp. USMAA2-4]